MIYLCHTRNVSIVFYLLLHIKLSLQFTQKCLGMPKQINQEKLTSSRKKYFVAVIQNFFSTTYQSMFKYSLKKRVRLVFLLESTPFVDEFERRDFQKSCRSLAATNAQRLLMTKSAGGQIMTSSKNHEQHRLGKREP